MENSNSFIDLENMIRQGWFQQRFSEFENLLDLFEDKDLIRPMERVDLLKRAKDISFEKQGENARK